MASVSMQLDPLRKGLLRVGFREDRLRSDFLIPGSQSRVPLLAFADRPYDSRTASIAVLDQSNVAELDIAAIRPLGAPLVFACLPDHCQLWLQGRERPRFHLRLTPRELSGFFEQHRDQLAPDAIYRAKVWGRLERGFQLEFVDAGFLPLIEEEAGQKLTNLIERVVSETKHRLGWKEVSEADGRWLLQSTFWLLAAKILQDKSVPGFVRLDLADVEEVYKRLATHYHSESPRPIQICNRRRHDALVAASQDIRAFAHCGPVSTEALGFLYESALIDRTIRIKLGTHSTPTWLVDYIVGRLRPWVEKEIAVENRRVFEPACGHAGFLIAAMRLLSELLPSDWQQPRKTYLRERLHGLELDGFALEVARLSLTLADVPNPNGWALTEENMFKADLLESGISDATIVLGNPPFENFASNERRPGWLPNKAAETFRRVVAHLPTGGVFGFVLPQTFLHAKQAADIRRILLRDYEISEISLFADKVFRYGEPESTVIMGRRLARTSARRSPIRYQRVREGQIEEFSRSYEPSSKTDVNPVRMAKTGASSLLVPDLADVWEALEALPKFDRFADIGQGLIHKSADDPTLPAGVIPESPVPRKGLHAGYSSWTENQMTHALPGTTWLNLQPDCIRRPVRGTTTSVPQVLWNYARVSREAWRLKALIDEDGHPVTSRFNVVRSKSTRVSLPVLWAICNSPVANAYAYCISNKRDVLAGTMREMPVPDLSEHNLGALEQMVTDYLKGARAVT
ncbi:MAG: N-6 DNA methylase, partial [Verrucomicrobiota bacterium]